MNQNVSDIFKTESDSEQEGKEEVRKQHRHDEDGAGDRNHSPEERDPGMKEFLLGGVEPVFRLKQGAPHSECGEQ